MYTPISPNRQQPPNPQPPLWPLVRKANVNGYFSTILFFGPQLLAPELNSPPIIVEK